MRKITIVILTVLLLLSLIGCRKEEFVIYEDDYFEYIITNPDLVMGQNYSYIVGLTELGKKQKVLTISSDLGKEELGSIGYQTRQKEIIGDISSQYLEKLYINTFTSDLTNSYFSKTVYVVATYDNGEIFLKYDNFMFCLSSLDILKNKNLPEYILSRYMIGNVLFKIKNS
jgi:hypothetical protein